MGYIEMLVFPLHSYRAVHNPVAVCGEQKFCTPPLGNSTLGLGRSFPEHCLLSNQEYAASVFIYFLRRLLMVITPHLMVVEQRTFALRFWATQPLA